MRLLLLGLLVVYSVDSTVYSRRHRQRRQHYAFNLGQTTTTPRPEPLRTRSLSGAFATDGNNVTNAEVYSLMVLNILDGFAIWRIKGFNDRVYLEKFRRSYWFGDRYYFMDNFYFLATRETCAYKMNETERRNLQYEDGVPIYDIIYQCQKYAQYCCGLDCCIAGERPHTDAPIRMKYPWSSPDSSSALSVHVALGVSAIAILLRNNLWRFQNVVA